MPDPTGRDRRSSRAAGQSPTEYRRYTLHGFLVILSLVAAITAVVDRVSDVGPALVFGADQRSISNQPAGYLTSQVLVSTTTSVLARHQAEARATAAPSATPAPEAAATATPVPELPPAYFTYTVQPGDNVASIAAMFGVDPQYIIWNNPEVNDDPDLLVIGADVLVPSVDGIVYTVTLGDTLSDVAAYYGVDVDSIVRFSANGMSSPDSVIEGKVLLLPGAVPPAPPPAPQPVFSEDAGTFASVSESDPDQSPPSYSGYSWPFYGNISQYFSGYHRGIDIDGFGSYGAAISAAADGVVVLATYQEWGYGYHVIIEHADGSRTLYGHLSDIWVYQGQYVGQGEAIGALGSTGYSTGPHVHFEVHLGGPVDPLDYLP